MIDFTIRLNKLILEKCDNNQIRFANCIGYSQQTVNSWCTGARMPNSFAIVCICKEFNVSADWLLGLKEDE